MSNPPPMSYPGGGGTSGGFGGGQFNWGQYLPRWGGG